MCPLRKLCCVLVLAGAAMGIALSCGVYKNPPPESPLEVLVDGCDMVYAPWGEVACTFPKFSIVDLNGLSDEEYQARAESREPDLRKMNLWVEGAWNNYEVRADGRLLPSKPTLSNEGSKVPIAVPSTARRLTVELGGRALYELPIIPSESPPAHSGLNDVMAQWRQERGRAEAALPAFVGDPSHAVRAKATALFARAELRQGNVQGAVTSLYESIDAADRAGLITDKVLSGLVLARTLIVDQRELAEGAEVLTRISGSLEAYPAGRAMEPYFRAFLWSEMGYLHGARQWLDVAEMRLDQLHQSLLLKDVHEKSMEVSALLGLHERSERHFEALMRALPAGVCQDAQRELNLGWRALITGGRTTEAIVRSERALDLLSPVTSSGKPGCDNLSGRATATMNLAQALVEARRWREAEQRLNAARGMSLAPRLAAWLPLLEGRIALSRGDYGSSVVRFEEAAHYAAMSGLPYAESAALYGRAEAIEASGKVNEALGAYARADEALQRWGALIPFGGGLQSFFGRHDRGVRRHIGLLLEDAGSEGAVAEAACLARRNLARIALSIAAERRAGKLSQHHLARALEEQRRGGPLGSPAPVSREERVLGSCLAAAPSWADLAPGEAMLVVHPIEVAPSRPSHDEAPKSKTWAGFLITREGVSGSVLKSIPERLSFGAAMRETLAQVMLRPFTRELERVERRAPLGKRPVLRAALAESLSLVPLHDLPWGDRRLEETLSDRFSVLYTLDLPSEAPAREQRGRTALIVVEPGMVEYKGSKEVLLVDDALKRSGWRTLKLEGQEATHDRVLEHLKREDVELFHFIGHGHASEDEGFDDAADLAFGKHLTITDILDLGRAPRYVTLSACRGAASRPGSHVQGMSLAGAFLLMGAQVVVASRVDVRDAPAFEVMSKLYEPSGGFLNDPAGALYGALRGVPDRGLADFRVIVR